MKTALKILWRIFAAFVILVVACAILAQTSRVQTHVARKVTEALTSTMDADVKFSKIHFKPVNTLILKDFVILDRHPFEPCEEALEARGVDSLPPVDTFFSAKYVIARFTLKGLREGNVINLDKVHIKDGQFNLVLEDGRINLQRLFGLKMDRSGAKPRQDKDLFNIKTAKLENMQYRMISYRRRFREIKGDGIDWNDLHVTDIDLDATNLRYKGGIVYGEANNLSFKEKSGFNCKYMDGKVRVGHGKTVVEEIHIIDDFSDIYIPYYIMSYTDAKSFRKYVGQVMMDGEVRSSKINMKSIGYFVPGLQWVNRTFIVNGKVDGNMKDLDLTGLSLRTPDGEFDAKLTGNVRNVMKLKKAYVDLSLDRLETTTSSLESVVRSFAKNDNISITKYAPDEEISATGHFSGKLNSMSGGLQLRSTIGDADVNASFSDLMNPSLPTSVEGRISTADLNIGKVLAMEKLGKVTMSTSLHAELDKENGPSLRIDSLMIDKLGFNGYEYSKIAAVGNISAKQFDGKIISQDPALNFLFQGMFALGRKTQNAVYQFYANVGHADLHAMNFDKREKSNLSFTTKANFTKVRAGDLLGNIDVEDMTFESEDGYHDLGDISVSSRSGSGLYRINLESEFIKGNYIGTEPVGRFASDIVGLTAKRELPILFKDPSFEWGGAQYDIDLTCVNTGELASFINPDLYIDDDTSIGLSVYRNGIVDGRIKTHRIAIRDKYIKDLDCTLDNLDDRLSANLAFNSISTGDFKFENGDIRIFAEDNNISLGLSYDNETGDKENRGDVYAFGRFLRDEDGELAIHTEIIPSAIVFEDNSWLIGESALEVGKSGISVDSLSIMSGEQYLSARGGISKTKSDSLDVAIQRFNIGFINNFLKNKDLALDGVLSGDLTLRSNEGSLGYTADVICDSTRLGTAELGTLTAKSFYNSEFSRYEIDVRSLTDGMEQLALGGTYTPASKWIDLKLLLNDFGLAAAKPLATSVFSDMGGYVSGEVVAEGRLDDFRLYCDKLRLDNALLRIAYTHVPYFINGTATLDEYGVYFDKIGIRDRFGAKGTLDGSIYYDHFKDIGLNLNIETSKMELIDIPYEDKLGFYGNIFGTGTVELAGPLSMLSINVDASTLGTGKGDIHIPLSDAGEDKNSNLLVFKEREKLVVMDKYEEMLLSFKEREKEKAKASLNVHIRANATPDVGAHLEINRDNGNGLTGTGSGLIDIDVIPSRSYLNFKGDYTLQSGNYRFTIPGIVTRDFSIKDGSSINFGGDLLESTLDVDAVYKTKASIATLVSDTTAVNTRRAVECGIKISDKLRNPQIKFSLDIPDLDPTVKSKVENALSTEDKVQRQFIALLVTNNFLPDEMSGITSSTSLLYSNVSEIMSRQINNIFEKLDIPLDLGVKYQSNTKGNDIFDVALSTQLFNNRVVVGGNLGNRQYTTGDAASDIAGDLDIEIKIDRPGALRLNIFSHHSDQYTNYLDNLQRNGIGMTYQKEFNSFGYLVKYMFANKAKKEQMEIEEQRKKDADGYKTITIERDDGNSKKKKK